MYSQNELLKRLKMDIFKEVETQYTASDLNKRFNLLYVKTNGFADLMARVKKDGLTDYHFEDYAEYQDLFVDEIVTEVLALLKKVPSKTIEEYLTEVKREVFKEVIRNGTNETLDRVEFDDRYKSAENYKLMLKSVKQMADVEGVIYNDDFDILIASDVTALIDELL
ncbi:hypothetical protein IGL98_000949 [Enterococcus sp. DIV0840]|uniref:hypothetical protein n=1 Tax=unclassified Enterococcus TaxID=2608891 RepID=UPI001A8EFC46|nr:hypothetical protein [Enterococcus sp. DIV0849a]MBO0433653.1 hypothetical protein [Enterococcus sp. DIV0849a]